MIVWSIIENPDNIPLFGYAEEMYKELCKTPRKHRDVGEIISLAHTDTGEGFSSIRHEILTIPDEIPLHKYKITKYLPHAKR